MTTETPLLDLPGVRVTSTKVTVRGTTYFLPNITSVRIREDGNVRAYSYAVGPIGLLMAIGGVPDGNAGLIVFGLVLVVLAVVMYLQGLSYDLIITTGAAEQQALHSSDKALLVRVLAAINVAVEDRMAGR